MKAHRRIRRATRALALAGCTTALALPTAAGARPIDYHPISAQQQAAIAAANAVHPHGRPAAYADSGVGSYEGSTFVPAQSKQAYTLPAGFGTDQQTNGTPATTTQPPSVVVREVRTVTSGPDHTLALVLASAALGIALCGSAYAVFRTTRIQRRVLGSNS
jgi:hypothetical protein